MNAKTTATFPVAPHEVMGCALRSVNLHRGAGVAVGVGRGVGRYAWIGRGAHGTVAGDWTLSA